MLSVEHLVTVAVIVVAITVLVAAARLRPGPWTEFAARALALLIVVNEVGWWVWAWQTNALNLQNSLPLFLCDIAAFVSAAAAARPRWTYGRFAVVMVGNLDR